MQHPNEIGPQLTDALDNLETVLKDAGVTLSNIIRLTIYTTDVDGLLENWDAMTSG